MFEVFLIYVQILHICKINNTLNSCSEYCGVEIVLTFSIVVSDSARF